MKSFKVESPSRNGAPIIIKAPRLQDIVDNLPKSTRFIPFRSEGEEIAKKILKGDK